MAPSHFPTIKQSKLLLLTIELIFTINYWKYFKFCGSFSERQQLQRHLQYKVWVTVDKIPWKAGIYRYLNHSVNHIDTVHAEALLKQLIWWFLPPAGENGHIGVKLYSSSTLHRCQGWCWLIYHPTYLLKLLQKTVAVCAQLGWPHFLFSLHFRNEKCLFEQYLSGKKKTYRVQEVLIESEFRFSFLPSFPPGKEDIKTCFVFYTKYNISCNKK